MIADKKRTLLPGTAYDVLIPRSSGKTEILLNDYATTDHTIKTVQSVVRSTLSQTAKVAPLLKGRDLRDTCSKIWHWVYQHIQYKNDEPGKEQVRHPARIWADRKRGVDCDDYTTIISSILLNLGIPHKLRVTDYGRGWQHIYIIVPKSGRLTDKLDQAKRDQYIVIDCVPNDFDYEVHYTRKMDIPMQLQVLSGLDGVNTGPDYGIDGLSGYGDYDPNDPELGNIFKKIGNAVKKGVQAVGKAGAAVAKVAKKVVASPVRAGILVFFKLNTKQSASRLRWGYLTAYNQKMADAGYGPKAYEQIRTQLKKLQNTYVSMGGRADALRGAILNSPGNKDKAVPMDSPDVAGLGYLASVDPDYALAMQVEHAQQLVPTAGLEGIDDNGLGVLPAAALIAAATPIVVPILNMLSKVKANDPGDPVPDEFLPQQSDEEVAADVEPTEPDPSVEGLGAVAKKKAAKVASVVAKNKPKLVQKATAKVAQKAGVKPAGKVAKAPVKPAAKAAVKPAAKAAVKAVKKGAPAAAAVATAATVAINAGAKPAAVVHKTKSAVKTAVKAVVKPAAKPAAKTGTKALPTALKKAPVKTAAQKKAVVKAVKATKTVAKVAAGAAAATAIAPIVRSLPTSLPASLPTSLPTVTDESGEEQIVMPTAPALDKKTAKKQAIVAKKFTKQQAKTAKKAGKTASTAPKQGGQPAGKATTAPVRVAPSPAPVSDQSYDDYQDVTDETPAATPAATKAARVQTVTTAISQGAQVAASMVKDQKMAKVLNKTGKVTAAVTDVIKASQDAGDSVADGADLSTDADASAAADQLLKESAAAPAQAGFFTTADGKPNWLNIGVAGLGAVMLGSLLSGSESAERHPRNSSSRKSKGLSGTPKKARKKAKKGKKRDHSLSGLEAVELS